MGGVISLQPKVLGFVWCTLSHRLFPKAMDIQPTVDYWAESFNSSSKKGDFRISATQGSVCATQ